MAIIQTVSASDFVNAFSRMGRLDGWTTDGLTALYDYLDQLSDDIGEPIELDVIALCCEWSEHDSALDCLKDNGYDVEECLDCDDDADEDELEEAALEWIQERACIIPFDGGVIVQGF